MLFSLTKNKPPSGRSRAAVAEPGPEKRFAGEVEQKLQRLARECATVAGRVESLRKTVLPTKRAELKNAELNLQNAQGKVALENQQNKFLAEIHRLERVPENEDWRQRDARNVGLSKRRNELEEVERRLYHYEHSSHDIGPMLTRVQRLQAEIDELEQELEELRNWGPVAFMAAKAELADSQLSLLQDAVAALRNFVASWKRIQELGSLYADASNHYIAASRNFSLANINAKLNPPLPRIQSNSSSGLARHAAELKEWRKRNHVVEEAPHRRWPGQDFDFGKFLTSISRLVS